MKIDFNQYIQKSIKKIHTPYKLIVSRKRFSINDI